MSAPKVEADEYIDFLIATPRACSATEAVRVQPDGPRPPAHDAFTRLLTRLEPDSETLWTEAEPPVRRDDGILVIDDSTLDKPYATAIARVTRHWSGRHRAVVRGINLVSLLWTDGDRHIPCDDRVYDAANDGKTKNDHSGIRRDQRWEDQERPLPGQDPRRPRPRVPPTVRGVRRVVRRPGEPEGGPRVRVGGCGSPG